MRFKAFAIFLLGFSPLFSIDFDIDHAIVGIYAVDSKTGKVLVEKNCDLSLTPASCMKIATTAAALPILGANYRFETQLEYEGEVTAEKVLKGNIYIQGGGDPTLGSGLGSGCFPGTLAWKEQIDVWAEAIQKLGIQKIEGSIVGDATKWEKALAVPSWSWEDLGNYYGAGACALSFHENFYSLFFKPSKRVGESASLVRIEPFISKLVLQNEVTTGQEASGDGTCIYGSEFSFLQRVRGTIPAGIEEFSIKGAIPDPAQCCAQLLAEELQKRGIDITHEDMNLIKPKNKRIVFHTTYSPTVKEIVYWTNQKSINLYAEHLLKKMGEVLYNEGSTSAGVRAVTHFWKSQNIDLGGFNMVDGSGLSRKNLITPKQLVEILLRVKKSDLFPLFLESLPEKSSTRAKSGSMALIKAYAGYAGDTVFAIIVNHCSDRQRMHATLDDFLSYLATLLIIP